MQAVSVFSLVASLIIVAAKCSAEDTNAVQATIGAVQAARWIGKEVVVTGVVAQVSVRPSLVFLNFEKAYPSNLFTAIIRTKNTNEFDNLPALRGKTVSVQGQIKGYNGKPEMELTGKSQLTVLGETK